MTDTQIGLYAKAIVGALIAFATALGTGLELDGILSSQEWVTAVAALVVGLGAIWYANIYFKAIVGAVVAGLGALGVALDDDTITSAEGLTIAIAFLTALGVIWAIPNAEKSATWQPES